MKIPNAISSDVSASGWYTATGMITGALNGDVAQFTTFSTGSAITRWEFEALSSLAAAAVAELADAKSMDPEAVLGRLRDSFLMHC